MHLALDCDVRIGDGGSEQLAKSAEEEGNRRGHLACLLHGVLHLLEEGILEDGVDDQDQGWHDTREQGLGSLILEEGHESADGGRGFRRARASTRLHITVLCLLASGDAGVDDPDRVGKEDCRGASDGTGHHGLNGGELLVCAAGGGGALLKESLGPFVPVVIYEVGDADAEQRRVDARIQPRSALPGNDLLDGLNELTLSLPGLDLGTSR